MANLSKIKREEMIAANANEHISMNTRSFILLFFIAFRITVQADSVHPGTS